MIYLFAGDDTKNKIKNYELFLASLDEEIEIFYINRNNFVLSELENFYSGAGLFFKRCAVVFNSVLEHGDTADSIMQHLDKMGESSNIFIFNDNKLNKVELDEFKKARAEINIFELPKEKKEKFNNFLLADALVSKDKLKLWIYFRQAMDLGVGMEELIGVLFWKIKDMILKKNFRAFTERELQTMATELSYLLPEARKGGADDEAVFERFLLEAF